MANKIGASDMPRAEAAALRHNKNMQQDKILSYQSVTPQAHIQSVTWDTFGNKRRDGQVKRGNSRQRIGRTKVFRCV